MGCNSNNSRQRISFYMETEDGTYELLPTNLSLTLEVDAMATLSADFYIKNKDNYIVGGDDAALTKFLSSFVTTDGEVSTR